MQLVLDEGTEPWGVYVERVEVKDVRVPEQLQRAMAAEAEAAREARAKVIAAEGEHKASRALKHAAEVITDSPAALQVNPPHYGARIKQFRPDLDRDHFCRLKRFLCLKFRDILKCQNTNDWFQGETNRRLPTLDEGPIRLHCWNFVDKTKEKKINIL